MAPPGAPALKFTLQTPPSGDLSHFLVSAIVPKPPAASAPHSLSKTKAKAAKTSSVGSLFQGKDFSLLSNVSGVIAKYQSVSGNQPNMYKNSVALWNSLLPNLKTEPLLQVEVPTDDQIGDVFLDYGLSLTDYSVTYQLGDSPTTMCALAQISQGMAVTAIPLYVSIAIATLTTDNISVSYNTLPGYKPATYKNWIGLWPGFALPYDDPPPPVSQAEIALNYTQGMVNLPFTQTTPDYTLIYFTGPELTNAAALLYFSVSS